MNLAQIKNQLNAKSILLSEEGFLSYPTVIGYDKRFRWSWMATQLNTFIVASDLGDTPLTVIEIEKHLSAAFNHAQKKYKGWPRGLQSGLGVISILISEKIDPEAVAYCKQLKSGKKWAGFTIPVVVNSGTLEASYFEKNPLWGRIYYPFFKKMIQDLLQTV